MDTKALLYGLIGFFLGGLLVSTAAATFESDKLQSSGMNMSQELEGLDSHEFDQKFLQLMILHHQDAIDMAKIAQDKAEHEEIKQLSGDILAIQSSEIEMMKEWIDEWGYSDTLDESSH